MKPSNGKFEKNGKFRRLNGDIEKSLGSRDEIVDRVDDLVREMLVTRCFFKQVVRDICEPSRRSKRPYMRTS